MSINEMIFDDLTIIKGIGPARQQWLRQSFGVRTYADLAQLQPDQIENKLKADGQIARRKAIEEWVGQARALAANEGTTAVFPLNRPLLAVSASDENWHPFASFVVEIQAREEEGRAAATRTAVQHIERDTNAIWPGIEREKLCQWIVAQVDAEVQQFTQEQTSQQPSPIVSPTGLRVVSIEFQQDNSSTSYRPERPLPIILCANQPFLTYLTLALAEPPLTHADVVVEVQTYMRSLSSRLTSQSSAVSTHHLAPHQATITKKMGETTLSTGQYRLQLFANLQDSGTPPIHLELPLLQLIE